MRSRTVVRCARAISAHLWLLTIAAPLCAAPADVLLQFERLNRTYANLVTDVEPIRNGPLTVRLSSSANSLTLEDHSVESKRLEGKRHRSVISIRFSGAGRVRAEIDFGGFPASFESDVVFPSQLVVVEGEFEVDRRQDGYEVTVIELPPFVAIEMRSTLVGQLVSWCSKLSFFVAGSAGCEDLELRLSTPHLPLPDRGESLFVGAEDLMPEERERIDAYLSGS